MAEVKEHDRSRPHPLDTYREYDAGELLELRLLYRGDMNEIDQQLDAGGREQEWRVRAQAARRGKGMEVEKIDAVLREHKEGRRDELAELRAFRAAARRLLSEEQYALLVHEAECQGAA